LAISEEDSVKEVLAPLYMRKDMSEIPEDSKLYNILDTGRLQKKFKDMDKIGQGGFGEVFKAKYHIDQKLYAIKVVRLHITKDKSVDPL
jgi:serine/threonine protein kinase